jgi:hypothetical protein
MNKLKESDVLHIAQSKGLFVLHKYKAQPYLRKLTRGMIRDKKLHKNYETGSYIGYEPYKD